LSDKTDRFDGWWGSPGEGRFDLDPIVVRMGRADTLWILCLSFEVRISEFTVVSGSPGVVGQEFPYEPVVPVPPWTWVVKNSRDSTFFVHQYFHTTTTETL